MYKSLKHIFQASTLVLLLLIHFTISYGQEITFDHLTIEQGLSNNTIYSIVEDSEGYMWFGTRDGLNRFDGSEFKLIDIEGVNISTNNISALACLENKIFIGMSIGGVAVYSTESHSIEINPFSPVSSFQWDQLKISSLFVDTKMNIWIGTMGDGVIRIDSTNNIKHYHIYSENSLEILHSPDCTSFAEDSYGNIWMGTSGSIIHKYDIEKQELIAIDDTELKNVNINSFRKTLYFLNDTLLIGIEGNGLIYYVHSTKDHGYLIKEKILIRDIEMDHNENMIISTDGDGLLISNDRGKSFHSITVTRTKNTGINTNALYDIYTDSRKNIWIGTFNGGINVHKPAKAKFLTFQNDLSFNQSVGHNSVLSIGGDSVGLWIGMDGGGLSFFDYKLSPVFTFKKNNSNLCSNIITCQLSDDQGNLWLGSFSDGLIYFDRQRNAYKCYTKDELDSNSLYINNVWSLQKDKEGGIWIGTLGGGLNHFNPKLETFKHYLPSIDSTNSISDLNVQCLLIDSKERLWVGTEFGGLDLFDMTTESFINFSFDSKRNKGLRSNSIRCLFEDSNNNIWIGTEGGGLHKLDEVKGEFVHFGIKKGFPSRVINSIEQDDNGYLWISTNKGISVLNPINESITNYYKDDGLLSSQFNAGSSFKDSKGRMYFGSINGVTAFDPSEITPYTSNAPLVFLDFRVQGRSIIYDEELKLNYKGINLNNSPTIKLRHDDNFSIYFTALDFTYPNSQKFKYRIVEIDDKWKSIDANTKSVTYSDLKPGNYTFELISNSNLVTEESNTSKHISIEILTPFWQSDWFKAIVALVILLFIITFYLYQINKKKQLHKEELMAMEQEILILTNKNLGEMVEKKSSELSAALLQSAHKNKSLTSIKKKLNDLSLKNKNVGVKESGEIKSLIRRINTELESEDYWELFQINFDNVHQKFTQKLIELHPVLSTTELRVCTLIKLGMSNSEIASIQNISLSAIEKSKYRIKKKLGFSKNVDLNHYIISLS